jgi:SAM-dependent methyltransferase
MNDNNISTTSYDLAQIIENEQGWLFYDSAFKNWKSINKYLKGTSILDIGCASGISMALGKIFNPKMEFVGIEGQESCRDLWDKRGLNVEVQDIYNLKYHNHSFDTVYTSHVLEHVNEPLELIEICFKLASKRVIHSVPDGDVDKKNFGSPHLSVYNRKNFKELFRDSICREKLNYSEIAYFSVPDCHMSSIISVFERKESA